MLVGALLSAACSGSDDAGGIEGGAAASVATTTPDPVTTPVSSELGADDESGDDAAEAAPEPSAAPTPAPDAEPEDAADDESDAVVVDATPEPRRTADDVAAPAGVQPEGFTTVAARVTSADGTVCEVCLWLADTAEERGRGLMGVTDLGEPVGMVFRFDEPISGRFWMFGTPMPLSIAWFSADGDLVGEADMEPCLTDDSATCERYGPDASYLHAVEMVEGELDVVGIGPGARLEVLGESPTCEI